VEHYHLPVKIGLISTGDAFGPSERDWQRIERAGVVVCDMEAMAIAQVLASMIPWRKKAVPLICLKGITDTGTIGHLDVKGISCAVKNTPQVMARVANIMRELIPALLSDPLKNSN
jgi:nucleoside phosphorylase